LWGVNHLQDENLKLDEHLPQSVTQKAVPKLCEHLHSTGGRAGCSRKTEPACDRVNGSLDG
jgi:hypothetical protein